MKIVLIVLGVIVVVALLGLFALTRGMKEIKALQIEGLDISKVPDGVYEGAYAKTRWKYRVKVTVKGGKIEDIEVIESPADIAGKAAQVMRETQSIEVDTVSGASINTRAFQKAVENALRGEG
jgi:uncharacterized protein with FMN-binding domain